MRKQRDKLISEALSYNICPYCGRNLMDLSEGMRIKKIGIGTICVNINDDLKFNGG